jgi:hypothetical protein
VAIPPEMLSEIHAEAARIGMPTSALMRRAWRIARRAVAALPSSEAGLEAPVGGSRPDDAAIRESISYEGVDYEFAIHPDRAGATGYVRDPATGALRYAGMVDARGPAAYYPGVDVKYGAAFRAFVRRRWPATS